ncbi:MAG TPA: periplasmic heavy metal sensor [Azospirillaceae bacterium]|nr:periplasmic heavy metal sensor [Azospirillaceae bacterium]
MSRTVKILAALLTLSVALNLLVGGMILGRWLQGPHGMKGEHAVLRQGGDRPQGKRPRDFVERFVASAPEEMRPYMREALEGRREEAQAHRSEVQEARRAVGTALAAEPFDRAAAGAALERLRTVTAEGQRRLHEVVLQAYEAAPPEVRAKAAARQWRERGEKGEPQGR